MKTTAANPSPATETFASAYSKLATIAEKLRGAGATACVDDLVLLLREAREHHAFCAARLAAIRREVDAEVETGDAAAKA